MTELAEKVIAGHRRSLARAATLVESRLPEARSLLRELFPHSGRALILGVTGAPGAGKSTLTDQLAAAVRRAGLSAAIIAVDPTSPYSGGAILGDRIRMQRHHDDSGVFIRSMATRGWMGGIAQATADMAMLFDAAGRDVVIVETVGVGQDEVEIARLAGATLLVLVPGMGDDVQALKAGIMEVADVFVINKSDLDGADKLDRELRASLALAHRSDGWLPPIVRTVATAGQGIDEVLAAARDYHARGLARGRTREIWALRLREMLRERLLEKLSETDLDNAARAVAERRADPYSAVEQLLNRIQEGRA